MSPSRHHDSPEDVKQTVLLVKGGLTSPRTAPLTSNKYVLALTPQEWPIGRFMWWVLD